MILLLLETLVLMLIMLIVHRLLLLRERSLRKCSFKIGLWLIRIIAIFMLWGKVGINIDTYINVAWHLCTHLVDLIGFRNTRVWVIVDPISTLVLLLLHVHFRSLWLIAFRANFIWLISLISFSTSSCPWGLLLRSTSASERLLFLTSPCSLQLWSFWLFILFFTTILCAALTRFIDFTVIFSKLWVLFYKAVIYLDSEFVRSTKFL